jgi:hypothetical protein
VGSLNQRQIIFANNDFSIASQRRNPARSFAAMLHLSYSLHVMCSFACGCLCTVCVLIIVTIFCHNVLFQKNHPRSHARRVSQYTLTIGETVVDSVDKGPVERVCSILKAEAGRQPTQSYGCLPSNSLTQPWVCQRRAQ